MFLPAENAATLRTIARAKGTAIRSNYTADRPGRFGWQIHYAAIDALLRTGLIIRAGRFYDLSETGRQWLGARR